LRLANVGSYRIGAILQSLGLAPRDKCR
jgi:hypothetical protein